MIDWQKILWDLKHDYKHLAAIAREIGYSRQALQRMARGEMKKDFPYTVGAKIVELHQKHCNEK